MLPPPLLRLEVKRVKVSSKLASKLRQASKLSSKLPRHEVCVLLRALRPYVLMYADVR